MPIEQRILPGLGEVVWDWFQTRGHVGGVEDGGRGVSRRQRELGLPPNHVPTGLCRHQMPFLHFAFRF